jgi:PAS domain S-box-containing protein
MSQKKSLALAQVLQRLVLLRMFLPLVALSVVAIGGVGYLGERNLETQQHQMAQSIARIVDRHLDQAARTLDAVARVAELSPLEDLLTFMQGTWEAYGYFDTLYYLDVSSKITLLTPPDPRYRGLDMSNLPYFQQNEEKMNLIISRPFISLRTGIPTTYLVRQLSRGGQVVGELNLGSLQDEITRGRGAPSQDVIFIVDRSGMLLAHPTSNLVKQQTNQGYLEIFRRGLGGDATLVYEYAGTTVLGSAARVQRTGWVVVVQVPLSVSLRPYAWALGLTLLASLAIWLALAWSLRNQLEHHVVIPLTRLSRGTGALANGDFSQGKALASIPAAFDELTTLATDFQHMSDALQARQVALQESEERFRSLFDRMPVPLLRSTPAGQHLDVNPAGVHVLGYPDQETLLKVNAGDLYVNPQDRQRWHSIAERDGIVRNFEVLLRRRDGTIIWGRLTNRAVQDSEGHVAYYEGSIEDVTERKRAEEEIRRLNLELEERVRDRTAQLEAANQELEAFAYSVSHDLRAPLRHIDGFVELLQERTAASLDERSRYYMASISDATNRMGMLIDDLLSFSRMGRHEMSKMQVDLRALAQDVIREMEPEARGRTIRWQVADLPVVSGDCAMLRIVLVNLISNALKFTRPREQPEIEIGWKPGPEGDTIFFVRDNGVGFDMNYADKLFGVFQRLHRAEEFEGTGIGLANVRRIINRHGGRTWTEGKVDHGATFYFSLP